MEDNKITDLSQATDADSTDILMIVDGPGESSPQNKKITIWDAVPFSYTLYNKNTCKVGEILEIFDDNTFIIKTIDGTLLIKEFECDYEITNHLIGNKFK